MCIVDGLGPLLGCEVDLALSNLVSQLGACRQTELLEQAVSKTCPPLTAGFLAACREYNAFAASVAKEVEALRATQATAIAKQMELDEESLQRLKAEKADGKVRLRRGGREASLSQNRVHGACHVVAHATGAACMPLCRRSSRYYLESVRAGRVMVSTVHSITSRSTSIFWHDQGRVKAPPHY